MLINDYTFKMSLILFFYWLFVQFMKNWSSISIIRSTCGDESECNDDKEKTANKTLWKKITYRPCPNNVGPIIGWWSSACSSSCMAAILQTLNPFNHQPTNSLQLNLLVSLTSQIVFYHFRVALKIIIILFFISSLRLHSPYFLDSLEGIDNVI